MGSVRPSVHPSAFPDQTAKPGAQKERAGRRRGEGGGGEGATQKQRGHMSTPEK